VSLPASLLELLACPECRGPLAGEGAGLRCGACGRGFEIAEGIPQLLPAALAGGTPADPAWRAWASALDRLLAWRRQTWTGDARAAAMRQEAQQIQAEFAGHCRLDAAAGALLDIGCGSGGIAARLPAGCRYVGLDPLPLPTAGGPFMVRGVGERLPFRDAAFDLVLAMQTLDHCQSAPALLAEILRVLAPSGALCVEQWVSPPTWRERLAAWRRDPRPAGRPAPSDSSKVVLLDASDVEALLRPAFREVAVARASQGSHVFALACGKRPAAGG
jgi:SAM-dependent methyltransferase/uncharacterized protein YbaR (Trm112 family)